MYGHDRCISTVMIGAYVTVMIGAYVTVMIGAYVGHDRCICWS